MHNAVRILVDKIDSLSFVNLEPVELDFFLNKEQESFIKHRASGNHARGIGFEETQKRMDDLSTVTKAVSILPQPVSADNKPNGRFIELPNTSGDVYWFAIQEEASVLIPTCKTIKSGSIEVGTTYIVTEGSITYSGTTYSKGNTFVGVTKLMGSLDVPDTTLIGTGTVKGTEIVTAEVKPLQHDDYNKARKDPFNKPALTGQYNQLRRLQLGGKMEVLLPDENAILQEYKLRYIRKPQQISLTSSTDCELADHTHQEIVDMVVSSILETIESGRYQTNLNELNKIE